MKKTIRRNRFAAPLALLAVIASLVGISYAMMHSNNSAFENHPFFNDARCTNLRD